MHYNSFLCPPPLMLVIEFIPKIFICDITCFNFSIGRIFTSVDNGAIIIHGRVTVYNLHTGDKSGYEGLVLTSITYLLYLTQLVAEGIMFLTRPSVRQSVRQSCFSCQRYSSETAQQNFVKLCSYEGHNV